MIHTIKIDDKTPTGKRLIKELRKHHKIVEFENTAETGVVPEGYLTGDEFENQVKDELSKYNNVVLFEKPPGGYMTGDEFFSGIKEELKKRSQENGLLQQNCSE